MPIYPCHHCSRTFKTHTGWSNHRRSFHKDLIAGISSTGTANADLSFGNLSGIDSRGSQNLEEKDLSMDVESSTSSFDCSFEMSTSILDLQHVNSGKIIGDDNVREKINDSEIGDDVKEQVVMNMNLEKNIRNIRNLEDLRLDGSVELMEILRKANAPLYLYKEICNWATSCNIKNDDYFREKQYSRKTVLKKLEHKFNLQNYHPQKVGTKCPSGISVDVVIHDFETALFSLLSDTTLMTSSNLLLNENEPWISFENNDCYADINSGLLWKMGWETYCNATEKDVLCPLIFFIDKTHTDVQGKLSLEPVCFTLGIFDRKTRNQAFAWRTIGYVTNFDLLTSYKGDAEAKLNDYHFILSLIFKSVKEAQQKNGISWELFGKKCSLKIPVLTFLGDTEGHDKLVGRLGSRFKVPSLCRYCDCPFDKTYDGYHVAKYIVQKDIQNGGNILKKLGYYKLKNSCHDFSYCDNERGIHGATPGEIVHVIQHGLIPYIINGFFRAKASFPHEIRKENQTDDANDDEVYDKSDDDTKMRRNVFSDDVASAFETRAKILGKIVRRQSERDLPRTYFSQGILPSRYKQKRDSKKLAAHEQSGVIIASLLCLMSTGLNEKYFAKKLTRVRLASWISVLEKFLLFENVLKSLIITKRQTELLRRYIPLLMNLVVRVVKRRTSVKWNIVKFHLLLHIPDDIERYGSYQNVSTGRCESHHKTSAKKPAKNTQRISNIFHEQVGLQYANNLLLDLYGRQQKCKEQDKKKQYHENPYFEGQTIEFLYNENGDSYFYDIKRKKRFKFKDAEVQKDCLDFLSDIAAEHDLSVIACFTLCKYKNWLVRANPYFKNEEWFDWICFKNKENKMIPVHLLLFIKIPDLKTTFANTLEQTSLKTMKKNYLSFVAGSSDIYAVANFLSNPLNEPPVHEKWGMDQKAHQESLIFYYARKNCNKNQRPNMQLITMERMIGTCIAVPDINAMHPEYSKFKHHNFIFMKNREEWNQIFFDNIEEIVENNSDVFGYEESDQEFMENEESEDDEDENSSHDSTGSSDDDANEKSSESD